MRARAEREREREREKERERERERWREGVREGEEERVLASFCVGIAHKQTHAPHLQLPSVPVGP